MPLKEIEIFKVQATDTEEYSFKLCSVHFDEACTIKDQIQNDLFNIIWIKDGMSKYQIDFSIYDIDTECIFFLTPGQVFKVESEEIKIGYRLAFSQDFYCVETQSKETGCNGVLFNNIYEVPFINPNKSEKSELEAIILKMFDEFKNPGAAHKEMLNTYLKLFLIVATRIKLRQQDMNQSEKDVPDPNLVYEFSQLVERNFRKYHSVSDYANLLNLSPKTLSKQLHRLKGKSPSVLIKDRLILEAKRDLNYSNLSVKEIAYQLGFDDPAYFTRFFKKSTNYSPNHYKEKLV